MVANVELIDAGIVEDTDEVVMAGARYMMMWHIVLCLRPPSSLLADYNSSIFSPLLDKGA